MGHGLAAVSQPEKLAFSRGERTGGVLHTRVQGGDATELQQLEPMIVDRTNSHFGYGAVARLRLVHAPVNHRQAQRRKPERAATPDPELKAGLREVVSAVADDEARAVTGLGIRVLQLHGTETPGRVAELKTLTGAEVWKAVGVREAADLAHVARFTAADRLLIDAKPPEGTAIAGGHGAAFDWTLLKGWTSPRPWLLAGGLTLVHEI